MQTLIVFDDTVAKSEVIADIIGNNGFADVIVKRRKLELYYKENLQNLFSNLVWKTINSVFEFNDLISYLDMEFTDNIRILHCFSNYIIADSKKSALSFEKLNYINDVYKVVSNNSVSAIMFPDISTYKNYLNKVCYNKDSVQTAKEIKEYFEIDGLINIGKVENFIQCISGNFDSRYFNSLKGNEFTLVKSSSNKKKIKSEYMYYHFLPDDMKIWFVMPFDYQEYDDKASYTMERLHMTDLAIKWVHGSIDEKEFSDILDKYFYFINNRHKRKISEKQYNSIAKELYEDKVLNRIDDLKKLPEFEKIRQLLEVSTNCSIDDIVNRYLKLKKEIEKKNKYEYVSVIGHGDPCFANTMYNKSTKTLKFIDPKGALKEEDLWTNPYYDLAKISHSICGRYDYFNNALFDIKINSEFKSELNIDFDNSEYISIFRRKLKFFGYDYLTVRIYEASLFISMLPLHIDYPHKVFGFILNAINMLDEIEREL